MNLDIGDNDNACPYDDMFPLPGAKTVSRARIRTGHDQHWEASGSAAHQGSQDVSVAGRIICTEPKLASTCVPATLCQRNATPHCTHPTTSGCCPKLQRQGISSGLLAEVHALDCYVL